VAPDAQDKHTLFAASTHTLESLRDSARALMGAVAPPRNRCLLAVTSGGGKVLPGCVSLRDTTVWRDAAATLLVFAPPLPSERSNGGGSASEQRVTFVDASSGDTLVSISPFYSSQRGKRTALL
jgi:hypothetical protein